MKVKIRTVLAVMAVWVTGTSVSGQDLIARQAPVDKKMKMADSLSLRRMFLEPASSKSFLNLENPCSSLYPEWNNSRTRTFGVEMPKEYKVDLRGFSMPCDSRVVTSHYGYRRSFRRNHYGTDIKVYVGDTIRSVFSGKVRVVAYEGKGYGNYVIVRHENGLETVYGHMSKHLVKENQIVRSGEAIGLGGSTGRSTGSHLHIETRFLGEYIDPERIFDFVAHDVKGDYYVYRHNARGGVISDPSLSNASPLLAATQEKQDVTVPDEMVAMNENTASISLKAAEKDTRTDTKKKTTTQARKENKKLVHSVKSGDTLYGIARKYNTTVEKLCKVNRIKENTILHPGQVLKCS